MAAFVVWTLALLWTLVGSGWLLGDALGWSPPLWAVYGPVGLLLLVNLRYLFGHGSLSHADNVQRRNPGGSER